MSGYFSVSRNLLQHALWLDEPFTRGQAWVDLIGLANYDTGFLRIAGQRVEVLRGQCGWSEVKLAERWQWSRGKVQRFINELKNDARITVKTSTRNTIITICNYDDYQLEAAAIGTTDGTTDEQQTSSRQDTIKKNKKNKKNKKEEVPPTPKGEASRFGEFYKIYPKKVERPRAEKAYERAISRAAQETIITGARRYADACRRDDRPEAYRFIKHPSTWLNNDCWNDIQPSEDEVDLLSLPDDERVAETLRRAGVGT